MPEATLPVAPLAACHDPAATTVLEQPTHKADCNGQHGRHAACNNDKNVTIHTLTEVAAAALASRPPHQRRRHPMSRYLRLEEAPTLTVHDPQCGACDVEVDLVRGSLVCPSCGTTWSQDDSHGTLGTLPPEAHTEGPACPVKRAWIAAGIEPGPERDKVVAEHAAEYAQFRRSVGRSATSA